MKRMFLLIVLCMNVALVAQAAPVNHGDFMSDFFFFNDVTETTDTVSDPSDPAVLFGAPTAIGSGLFFSPTQFIASDTAADGVADFTGSLLNAEIEAKSLANPIDILSITEFGDTTLTGSTDASTNTFVGIAGFVTVLEVGGAEILPIVIPITSVFTPGNSFSADQDGGLTNWTGSATVSFDQATLESFDAFDQNLVGGATKVRLAFDQNLTANAGVAGDVAQIQKKGNIIVEVVPEPGTGMLLATGLLLLGGRRRRN